jgi:hypothetical protein
MDNNKIENTPNAGKLISSLRNTGYDNTTAIADLVDNSIDADSSNIRISIVPVVNDFKIIISDDGSGMNKDVLDQAMRLGSDTTRNTESDLGKFGMGLVTASISLGKKLTVISKTSEGIFTSVQDLAQIEISNKFEKELRESTEGEISEFNKENPKTNHGTVVIIEKCDRLQNTNINQFSKNLVDTIGQIFRMFIQSANRNIYIRGEKIAPVDPLFLDDDATEMYSDETFSVIVNGNPENLRLRIVATPDFGQQMNRMKGINVANQGFYLMRNNREIASGQDLGIFTKHNDLNRLRMEVFFSGNIDNEMGINFTKRDVKPIQSVVDKITQIAYPQIASFRAKIKRGQVRAGDKDIDHLTPAKVISEKSKLLANPKPLFTPRKPTGENPGTVQPTGTGSEHNGTGAESPSPANKMNCEFLLRELKGGNLFEVEQIGKKVIIYYNIDHPFYQEVIAKNKDNKEIISTIDYLVYSLATAKLISVNRDNQPMFEMFDSIFSSNLRALIG